jgi:hypothetical protein
MKGHQASAKLELSKKETKNLDKTAKKFYKSISAKKPIAPKMKDLFSHNAFRVMSQSEFADSSVDTKFWKQDGYYNKVYPTKIGVIKTLLGSFMHGLIKMLVKVIGHSYKKQQKRKQKLLIQQEKK